MLLVQCQAHGESLEIEIPLGRAEPLQSGGQMWLLDHLTNHP